MQRALRFASRLGAIAAALLWCSTSSFAQIAIPAASDLSDQKPGSVLIYNFFTSSASSGNSQNTTLSITNTNPTDDVAVHFFLVTGSNGTVNDFFVVNLGADETVSMLASDLLPGISGFAVAVAVDGATGCPVGFNHLAGDAYVKLASGHHTSLAAVAVSALYSGVLAGCDAMSTSADLVFDGAGYNRLPQQLALDSITSRADGNDTLLIVNQLAGDLRASLPAIGGAGGSVFDDAINERTFAFSTMATQFRSSLTNAFPQTTPNFETLIPAGRSGWLRTTQNDNAGWSGAAINFNANAATSASAFNGGLNLHAETFSSSNTLTMPVSEPSTVADVVITKSHAGNLIVGTTTSYVIDVKNKILRDPVMSPIVVTDTLPADLTLVGYDGGGDWTCGTVGTANVSCTNINGLAAGDTSSIELFVAVGDATPLGVDAVTNTATVSIAPQTEDYLADNQGSETSTVLCVDCAPVPADTQVGDSKTGSILVYNLLSSSAMSSNVQNTKVSITNTNPDSGTGIFLYIVDGATGAVDRQVLGLGPDQTVSFLASDVASGTVGYAIAVAVDVNSGCPVGFNHLAGDADFKLASGHHTGLAAMAISALYDGVLPGCNAMSDTTALVFDDVKYNRLPQRLALDNFGSNADGNSTLLALNQLSGDLSATMPAIGGASGLLYDDAVNPFPFTFTGPPQFLSLLSNSFPNTSPSFALLIPAGRSGWLHATQNDNAGWSGAVINFNANAASAANAFNGGHNLHVMTTSATNTLTVPVVPCDPPVVTPAVIPGAVIGVPYNQAFSAMGGVPGYTIELSGSFPAGLSATNNVLSGTPTDAGTFTFTVTATDAIGCIGTSEYMLGVDDEDDVPASTEDGAPNGGDGNGDGTPDRNQPNVASLPSASCDGYITVVATGTAGCGRLMDVMTVSENGLAPDFDYDYPFGLVGFKLDCAASSMIKVIFHCSTDLHPITYRKYGPEAPVFGDPHYYTLPGVVFATTKVPPVTGASVLTASFTLTNGLLGDGTPAADEMIVDPGGPAMLGNLPIPAASPAGVVGLIAMLTLLGGFYLRAAKPSVRE